MSKKHLTYISLPPAPASSRRLSFFLAMEEYVAQHLKELDDGRQVRCFLTEGGRELD